MKYILLGIIQGLTEFLPVSSSGHLVIFQSLLKVPHSIAFDVVVHLATALAVIVYFWNDILGILKLKTKNSKLMMFYLFVGTVFTGILGLGFKDFFESLFSSVFAVGCFLLLTGAIILLGEWIGKGKRKLEEMNIWDAVLIGLAQGCAIAPGLSRSGATISASLGRNLDRTLAARFSFLLSVPAILGAGVIQSKAIVKAGTVGIGILPLILGFAAAFISGWIAIKIFMNIIQRTSIRAFAYYCFVVGILILSFTLGGCGQGVPEGTTTTTTSTSTSTSSVPSSTSLTTSTTVAATTTTSTAAASTSATTTTSTTGTTQIINLNWQRVTNDAFSEGRGQLRVVAINNKLVATGGRTDSEKLNEVWVSTDGENWTQTNSSDFPARYGHESLVFDNKVWVMGGWDASENVLDDVWYSSNEGESFIEATDDAAVSARGFYAEVTFEVDGTEKMYIFGGYDSEGGSLSDTWCSEDGVAWTIVIPDTGFSPRHGLTALNYNGNIWLIGGGSNDVWRSNNMVDWTQVVTSPAWGYRAYHGSTVFDNKMWLVAGTENGTPDNDVYYSVDGSNWALSTSEAAFSNRNGIGCVSFAGKIWIIGDDGGKLNDVWSAALD